MYNHARGNQACQPLCLCHNLQIRNDSALEVEL